MPPSSFVTKVGSTSDVRAGRGDVVVVHEPDIGATLRTKGRLYLLCEVAPPGSGVTVAREVAELAKQEYYYDLSAGIEVSLRRALRQANRRAAQRLRDHRNAFALHVACAVIVGNEIYGARVGAAQPFLVRRARLFLPGDEPGELADFVHRTTTRDATSFGAEPDVLPRVWRQGIEPGDTLILASSALVEGLGAEALRGAAVTLHPRAAAEHIHNRAVAEGVRGSDGVVFIEIVQSTGAPVRAVSEPVTPAAAPDEVVIAESIRSRIDALWRRRPRLGWLVRAATGPVANVASKGVAVGLELMPRRRTSLPRHPDTARERSRRQRRAITTLALLLLLVSSGVAALAVRDYESTRAQREYQLALLGAEQSLASAHNLADRRPPDPDGARARIAQTRERIAEARRSPLADHAKLDALEVDAAALSDRLDGVIVDLARISPGAKGSHVIGNINGLYVADPGSGRLWRIFGDPLQTGVVMERGARGVSVPTLLAWQGDVLYALDDQRKIWRAEGDQVVDVTPADRTRWRGAVAVAVFTSNLYVLDPASGQLWKHESNDGIRFGGATAYLAEALPANAARGLAVDGDVWIVDGAGQILRYRRNPLAATAARIDFAPRWQGSALRASAMQAVAGQSNVYVLDAGARAVVQLARDGRELLRVGLPATLPEPTAFYVSEVSRVVYTLHGSKVVATSLDR